MKPKCSRWLCLLWECTHTQAVSRMDSTEEGGQRPTEVSSLHRLRLCSIMSWSEMQRRTCFSALQICVSISHFSAEPTCSINPHCFQDAWVEFCSRRSNEMTRNWPSGHMGLILYRHPHGNWLCKVLLWIISELHRECMPHKTAQSFKVYSSERQQWIHGD